MTNLALSKHLLWKDYRQLRPALIGCWAILAVIMLLTFIRQLSVPLNSMVFFPDSILLVLAAPTLVAMAASGILIGHERETRSWNWSSSLPIHWFSSLLSKTIVWFVASVLMVSTLAALFWAMWQVCRLRGLTADMFADWISPQTAIMTGLVVPVIVYVCFSLAALLWRDTLSAFFGAAIVVAVVACWSARSSRT